MIRNGPVSDDRTPRVLEENFEESIHYVNTSITPPTVPDNIKKILDDDCCTNLSQNSSPFWVMCAALRELVQTDGALPVRGSLPDMATDTASYVTLQHIYHKQAQTQSEIVYRRASQIARNLGLPQDAITENEVSMILIFLGWSA